jgi:acetyl esterase/lipase
VAAAHRLAYGTEESQFGDLRVPPGAGPHPLVLLVHGGFWRSAWHLDLMDGLADDLLQRGIATWNMEYRRVGQPGGGWPGTFLDVAAAADFARALAAAHHLDRDRVVTVGHSAGGHLALWLAGRRRLPPFSPLASPDPLPVAGAVGLAPIGDLALLYRMWESYRQDENAPARLIGGSPAEYPDRYAAASPAALLPLGTEQVLIQGAADDRVPPVLTEAYLRAAEAAGDPVTYLLLPGVDHFDVIDPHSEAWVHSLPPLLKLLGLA